MPLKLPTDAPVPTKPKPSPKLEKANDANPLMPGDTIEYSITMEVSPQRGSKAWVKFGTTSSVKEDESAEQARHRVCTYVETELDRRLDDLA